MPRKKSSFPWGIALIGLGAYLYFQKRAAAPVSTPAAGPAALPVSTTTSTALPASTTQASSGDLAIVQQWAQQDGRTSALNFAKVASPQDITTMANVIREWQVNGRCTTAQCTTSWANMINKYNIR